MFDDKKGGVKSSDALERAAKLSLWDTQARRARGEFLSHSPCQLEVLIQQGHALGLDAAKHPELMWLAEAALTPEMPIGWLHTSIAGAVGGESGVVYYWSTVSGLAQWEHPHVSLLSGVCRRLIKERADEMKRALGEPTDDEVAESPAKKLKPAPSDPPTAPTEPAPRVLNL